MTAATATAIKIVLTSDYGTLSRGRHSARIGNGASATWAAKDASGNLVITEPGTWQLHCTDGFRRVAKAVLVVTRPASATERAQRGQPKTQAAIW